MFFIRSIIGNTIWLFNWFLVQIALTLCVFCFSWKFAQSEISINTSFTLCYSYILSKVAAQSVKRTKWNRTMWGLPVLQLVMHYILPAKSNTLIHINMLNNSLGSSGSVHFFELTMVPAHCCATLLLLY